MKLLINNITLIIYVSFHAKYTKILLNFFPVEKQKSRILFSLCLCGGIEFYDKNRHGIKQFRN